jgi:hypothetical protein
MSDDDEVQDTFAILDTELNELRETLEVAYATKDLALPCVPNVWPHERGLFTRHDFIYDAENNHYTCPAGQKLTKGQGTRTLRSKGRHRSLPSSDGLLHLFAQAEVHPRQAQEA